MDYQATADAIAARFTGITPPSYTWTTPTAGATTETDVALRVVTTTLPNQLGPLPALYVMPPEDIAFEWGPSLTMHLRQIYLVRLARAQDQDIARRMAALQAWRTPLILRVVGRIQLGLTNVDWAELRSTRIAEWTYAEVVHDIVELTIEVKIREQVAAAA